MKAIYCFVLFSSVLLCRQANAISFPDAPLNSFAFSDTALKAILNKTSPPVQAKQGFFGRLKQKVVAFVVKQHLNTKSKTGTKAVLGWIGLGMVSLGLLLLVLGSSGTAVGVLFFGGLLVALVSLLLPRSKFDKEQKKKGSKIGLLALGLGIAFVIVVAIAFSGLGHR